MNIYTPNQNDIIHETSVDFVLRPCAKEIHIVQYDKSLPIIKVELFRNGERYILPESGVMVNVRLGKIDRTFVYETVLGTNEARDAVYFKVHEQMATIPGHVGPVIEVVESNRVACSSPIHMIIERNPIQTGQIESHDHYPIIYELQGMVYDHEERITALESQVSGAVVTLHTDQYNIDGKKGFTSDVYVDSTGTLSLRFTPTLSSHAVNKGYVDQAIENVEIRSDVIDVLGTHNDLENYDTSDVRLNDLIKVISDETRDNATTYYRWATIEGTNQWDFVALEGPYYTISQVDTIIERVDDDIADVDDRKLELHSFNGFVGGSQVCDQVSNGQIMYCQSGTQSEIDPTQSPIINIELTQEHISAVSNRKAVYIKKIHIEYESDDEPGVNKTWEYTFISRIFGAGTNQDDINPKVVNLVDAVSEVELEWTLIYRPATGKKYFGSYSDTKGQQFGSNTNPADYISLYTTSLQNVTVKNVTIEVSGNSGTQAKAKITLVQDVWEYTPEESEESTSSPVITASNESYPFYHGEEGTHLGTGGGTIIQYEHVFLKKENGEVSVIEPNHDYLYIEDNGTADNYRLYRYIGVQMQEVSKTRLGSTLDTAYRGDYGQDNYNKIQQIRNQTFTFSGVKTFADDTYFNSDIYFSIIRSNSEDGGYQILAEYNDDGYYWMLSNISLIGQDGLIFMQAEDSNDPGAVVSPINADSYRIMNLADPINNTDAVNKQYADTKYVLPSGGIPDSDIASASTWNAKYDKPSGGIPASDLADTYVLANTSITGATKCKITYDAKGLVTGGADLAASDIPSLDASKITSGTFADARIASASIWNAKQDALTFDITPTQGSSNPVTSGGVYTAIADVAKSTLNIINAIDIVDKTLTEEQYALITNGKPTLIIGTLSFSSVNTGWTFTNILISSIVEYTSVSYNLYFVASRGNTNIDFYRGVLNLRKDTKVLAVSTFKSEVLFNLKNINNKNFPSYPSTNTKKQVFTIAANGGALSWEDKFDEEGTSIKSTGESSGKALISDGSGGASWTGKLTTLYKHTLTLVDSNQNTYTIIMISNSETRATNEQEFINLFEHSISANLVEVNNSGVVKYRVKGAIHGTYDVRFFIGDGHSPSYIEPTLGASDTVTML